MRPSTLRLGLIVGVGLLLVGCGKHYWNKAGAGPADFNRESAECARENSVQMTANKDYGIGATVRAPSGRLVPRDRG
jgi:hypothetical protein